MKYIVGLLVVITIMHDVRIYRLNRNVKVLTAFFDEAVRRLKEFEEKHLDETEQTDCPWK
jgi:hypothetical protein